MVKLDRAFVSPIGTDAKSDSLLRAMVSIGRELDLAIVAEGVETRPQAEFVNALGVQVVQGWLYAPAMAPLASAWRGNFSPTGSNFSIVRTIAITFTS